MLNIKKITLRFRKLDSDVPTVSLFEYKQSITIIKAPEGKITVTTWLCLATFSNNYIK